MAIGHLTPEALKALRTHGHVEFWEVASYGGYDHPDSVTVECTKCMAVLVELVNPNQEEETNDGEAETRADLWSRFEKRFEPSDVDMHVHELKGNEAANINNAGLKDQFDYLYENAGADWMEQLLGEDKPLTPSRGDAVYCQNCDWEGEEADCNPIKDLHQRVAAGEPMPAGECPKCGALCQLKT